MKRFVVLPVVFFLSASIFGAQWKYERVARSHSFLDEQIATQSIASGGCTATVQTAPPGARLTFSCKETTWQLLIKKTSKGLQVQNVRLRRTPVENFMTVIYEANIAEIFVPYHDGNPAHRLYDNQHTTPTNATRAITDEDISGANAELIIMQGDSVATAAMEIRDRGIAWLCKWGPTPASGSRSRRGKELVVWGAWDTGNYEYLIEYTFRDDGQIGFRLGATGYDNPNKDYKPGEAHMHDILWRVDLDLNGSSGDSALLTVHKESINSLVATDDEVPFNGGKEGGVDIDPQAFTTLVIEDSTLNKRGNPLGYELLPFGRGQARHPEAFCQDDLWVTRYDSDEAAIPDTWTPPTDYLIGNAANQSGIFNGESVVNQDLVIWHTSPIHHEPHDEDQSATDPGKEYRGLTLTHWTGFDLVPHNLFDSNPLGAPDRSECEP